MLIILQVNPTKKYIYSGLKKMIFFRGPKIAKMGIYFTYEFVDWSPAPTMQFIFILLLQKLSASLRLDDKKPGAYYCREDISIFHPWCKLFISLLGHCWPCIYRKISSQYSMVWTSCWGIVDLASTEKPQVNTVWYGPAQVEENNDQS